MIFKGNKCHFLSFHGLKYTPQYLSLLFDTSRLQFCTSVHFILPRQYSSPSLYHQSETIDNQLFKKYFKQSKEF